MYRIGRTGFTVVGKSFGFCGFFSSHFWLQEELPQLAKAAMETAKFWFRNPKQLGGSSRRRGRRNRSHDWENTRILSPQELYKFSQRMTRVPLPLLTLAPSPHVCRVRMAELIPDLIAIRFLPVGGQGQVAGSAQRVLHPG